MIHRLIYCGEVNLNSPDFRSLALALGCHWALVMPMTYMLASFRSNGRQRLYGIRLSQKHSFRLAAASVGGFETCLRNEVAALHSLLDLNPLILRAIFGFHSCPASET